MTGNDYLKRKDPDEGSYSPTMNVNEYNFINTPMTEEAMDIQTEVSTVLVDQVAFDDFNQDIGLSTIEFQVYLYSPTNFLT